MCCICVLNGYVAVVRAQDVQLLGFCVELVVPFAPLIAKQACLQLMWASVLAGFEAMEASQQALTDMQHRYCFEVAPIQCCEMGLAYYWRVGVASTRRPPSRRMGTNCTGFW